MYCRNSALIFPWQDSPTVPAGLLTIRGRCPSQHTQDVMRPFPTSTALHKPLPVQPDTALPHTLRDCLLGLLMYRTRAIKPLCNTGMQDKAPEPVSRCVCKDTERLYPSAQRHNFFLRQHCQSVLPLSMGQLPVSTGLCRPASNSLQSSQRSRHYLWAPSKARPSHTFQSHAHVSRRVDMPL